MKRRERLVRLEQDLARSISRQDPRKKQLRLAEGVRVARIGALRADRAKLVPERGGRRDRIGAIDSQIALLQTMDCETMLAEIMAKQ
jgi:hypothetical protein